MATQDILRMEKHLKAVPVLLMAIEEDDLDLKPNPAKWSKKEILGHLTDSALYNLERFTKIRFCDPPFEILPYPQDALVKANNYQDQDVEAILKLWSSLNQQILSIWKSYSAEELKIPILDPKTSKEGDLAWWIEDYSDHLVHHLKQILGTNYEGMTLWLTSPEEAVAKLNDSEKPYVKLLEHGSMYVEYYAPEFEDLQQPHKQDELYIIDQGEGVFYNDGIRHTFQEGDVLFVPAGKEHRFENFSEDFGTWVIFYGPSGGEES